jgi:hypothetical protein
VDQGSHGQRDGLRRPWLPQQLVDLGWDAASVRSLSYVVIDEAVGDDIGLTFSRWPQADERGRLRFELDTGVEVAFARDDLEEWLYQGSERHVRVGDAFAVRLRSGALEDAAVRPGWQNRIADVVVEGYDMSAEARKLSKLAYYARVSGLVADEEAERCGMLELRDTTAEDVPFRRVVGAEGERGADDG